MATDPREPLGRLVHDTRLAREAEQAEAEGRQRFRLGEWEERTAGQRELDMRIGEAVAAAERERTGAQMAEVREVIRTFFTVHGNNTAASLTAARDLAEGIRQVLDREPLPTRPWPYDGAEGRARLTGSLETDEHAVDWDDPKEPS